MTCATLVVKCDNSQMPQDATHLACAYMRDAVALGQSPSAKLDTVIMKLAMKWLYDTQYFNDAMDIFDSKEEYRCAEAQVLYAFSFQMRRVTRYDRILEKYFDGSEFLHPVMKRELIAQVKSEILHTELVFEDDDAAVEYVDELTLRHNTPKKKREMPHEFEEFAMFATKVMRGCECS